MKKTMMVEEDLRYFLRLFPEAFVGICLFRERKRKTKKKFFITVYDEGI